MKIADKLSDFKANWIDIAFIKLSVFAATLLAAKYWTALLSLEWYWYAFVLILSLVKTVKTFMGWMKISTQR